MQSIKTNVYNQSLSMLYEVYSELSRTFNLSFLQKYTA